MMHQGRDPGQLIEVHIVQPPADLATRLEFGDGDLAAVRRRLRTIDGEPYMIHDSYFPLELVQGSAIMSPAQIARGANEVRSCWTSPPSGPRFIRVDCATGNGELHGYYKRLGFSHVRTVDLPHRRSGALFQRQTCGEERDAARLPAVSLSSR
jgi:hypothetical protein